MAIDVTKVSALPGATTPLQPAAFTNIVQENGGGDLTSYRTPLTEVARLGNAQSITAAWDLSNVSNANFLLKGTVAGLARQDSFGAEVRFSPVTIPGGVWNTRKIDGTILDQTGTTTDGLQESWTYAVSHGYPWKGEGVGGAQGEAPIDYITYVDCSTHATIPPGKLASVEARGLTINFGGGAANGVVVDSQISSLIELSSCQIVYAGTGAALLFKPTNPAPQDLITAIGACTIRITSPVCVGVGGQTVVFDLSNGEVSKNVIEIIEANAGNGLAGAPCALTSLQVQNPQANTTFEGNLINIPVLHLAVEAGIRLGTSVTNAANLRGNNWNIGTIKPKGAASYGIDCYGSGNNWNVGRIDNTEGTLNIGVRFRSSASGNLIIIGDVSGETTVEVQDDNGNNMVIVNGVIVTGTARDFRISGSTAGITFQYRDNAAKSYQLLASTAFFALYNSVTGAIIQSTKEDGSLAFGQLLNTKPMIKPTTTGIAFRLADDSADTFATASYFSASATIAYRFGGATNLFPGLKRSATQLQIRLADDSLYASLRALNLQLSFGSILADTADGTVTLTTSTGAALTLLVMGPAAVGSVAFKPTGAGSVAVRTGTDSADGDLSAGVLSASKYLKTFSGTLAALNAIATAAAAGAGARAYITDSTLAYLGANIGTPAVGGAANAVPVISVGGVWVIG